MKKYFKKINIMFVMLLTIMFIGTIQNGTTANAAAIGQQLMSYNYPPVQATSLSLDKTFEEFIPGQGCYLTAMPYGVGVTWSSSDPSVACVSNAGLVMAVGVGRATITATTIDGSNLSATCTINVIPSPYTTTTTGSAVTTTGSAVTTIGSAVTTTSSAVVLNIEPEKSQIHLNEPVLANLTIDNIKEIAAEDVRLKYDSAKLKFLGMDEVDGIKLVKADDKDGELRFILASKGAANVVEAKKVLLKLNFQGIASGDALVDVTKGRVSDGITMEKDLTDAECGQAIIKIDNIELKDVNNDGEFTLLDLAVDARHFGEDPKTLIQYNTDQVINGAIDEEDLLKIGEYMRSNPNYLPNK